VTRGRFRVEWAEIARGDLRRIIAYVLETSPEAAGRLLEKIEEKTTALKSMPWRGRMVPELARLQIREYRELQVPPYRVIYRVAEQRVLVLGVFDSRRNLEDLLLDRILSGSWTGQGASRRPFR